MNSLECAAHSHQSHKQVEAPVLEPLYMLRRFCLKLLRDCAPSQLRPKPSPFRGSHEPVSPPRPCCQ